MLAEFKLLIIGDIKIHVDSKKKKKKKTFGIGIYRHSLGVKHLILSYIAGTEILQQSNDISDHFLVSCIGLVKTAKSLLLTNMVELSLLLIKIAPL